ncbi:hypothetical protein M4R22_11235 [Acidovorax sp. GBBC 3334]|uniref:hypothetical protein n=1 Tax=Acidovorax sp. GBBC 3334 TaxID=2940496 RepID=UPI0023027D92|nr:hypothetical protein [Acidovorax sp. GBBC 3334]MDA8455333.1 hypothetical protein [Acidovorax sp. GBBC 3334]
MSSRKASTPSSQASHFSEEFKLLDKSSLLKFVAWSIYPFVLGKSINQFIEDQYRSGSKLLQEIILDIFQGRHDKGSAERAKSLLADIEWDVDDVDEDDFDASEGALKFLGATEMVIDFVLKGGRKNAVNSAIQFLEQIDYYMMNYDEEDMKYKNANIFLEEEFALQRHVLQDFKEAKSRDISIDYKRENIVQKISSLH